MSRPLARLLLNEVRGLAGVALFVRFPPSPMVAGLTALGGLALGWALIWRDLVKPELIARDRARRLAQA